MKVILELTFPSTAKSHTVLTCLLKVSGTYLTLYADLPCHFGILMDQLSTYHNV